ncbi:hypothetical protein ACPV40_01015 [Vibrio alfacsensis]|uniref:hypothetical protein n=1 Tax=Vibrio alfacsensis TaxID=1074311 RepID=UPI00406886BB
MAALNQKHMISNIEYLSKIDIGCMMPNNNLVGSILKQIIHASTNHEDDAMNINYVALATTEILLSTIAQNKGRLAIENVWRLEGEFYQQLGDALHIGMPCHKSTKLELHILDEVPPLLCSLTILCLKQPNLTRAELLLLIHTQVCLLVAQTLIK